LNSIQNNQPVNLLYYPDFALKQLHAQSAFWQLHSDHDFFTVNLPLPSTDQPLQIANFAHEPLLLENRLWGNRLFLKTGHDYQFELTYHSPVPLILGLYKLNDKQPIRFWRLAENQHTETWQQDFQLDDDSGIDANMPLYCRLLIPDSAGQLITLNNISLIDKHAAELPDITVGIVTFNRKPYLRLLLQQLQNLAYPQDKLHIVVVDNACHDGTADMLRHEFSDLNVLRNKENLGGAGGFNTFFKYLISEKLPTEFAWLIDDDAQVDQSTLTYLLNTLLDEPDAGIAGSVMMDLDARTHVYETGGSLYADQFGWDANLVQQNLDQVSHWDERFKPVGYVGAYSLLFRTEILPEIGIWRDYFLHVDDSEWCHRLQRKTGKKVLVVLDSLLWHVLQGARKPFTGLRYYETRNFLNYFASYTNAATLAQVTRQCIRFGWRQWVIKRADLGAFHQQGIHDFFTGQYGRQDLQRTAPEAKNIEEVLSYYRQYIEGTDPKVIYLLKELNDYIDDGIDHEREIIKTLRKWSPNSRLVEVSFHAQADIPLQADSFLHLSYHPKAWRCALQQISYIFSNKKGLVIVPFWNESMIANNLANTTAVYESGGYRIYQTARWQLLKTLFTSIVQFVSWKRRIKRGDYPADAAQVNSSDS